MALKDSTEAAAEKSELGAWTDAHLVTVDESRIDVRPRGPTRG